MCQTFCQPRMTPVDQCLLDDERKQNKTWEGKNKATTKRHLKVSISNTKSPFVTTVVIFIYYLIISYFSLNNRYTQTYMYMYVCELRERGREKRQRDRKEWDMNVTMLHFLFHSCYVCVCVIERERISNEQPRMGVNKTRFAEDQFLNLIYLSIYKYIVRYYENGAVFSNVRVCVGVFMLCSIIANPE